MNDPELAAMSKVHDALKDIDDQSRARVLRWAGEKFGLDVGSASHGTPKNDVGKTQKPEEADESFTVSLATHIKTKGGDGAQVQRFLATADWLRRRNEALSAGAIAKALQANHQSRLANPADCLNKNVSKGYCEKTKDGFFITPEGLKALGYT